MKKRLLALAMAGMVAVSAFAACSNNSSQKAENTPAPSASTEATTKDEPLVVETFKVWYPQKLFGYSDFETPVAKKITEKTGVKLDIQIPVGDARQAMNLMIASNDMPDMLMNFEDSLKTLVNADALLPLDELIEKHAPNIKAYYKDVFGRLKYSQEDPKIYTLLGGRIINNGMPGYNWDISWQVQYDVLKEQGWPKLQSLKDWENAIKTYKEKHPKIDGKDTIGISLLAADGWRHYITILNPAYIGSGHPNDGYWYVDQKTYDVKMNFRTPEVKEYFKWLNHLNAEGLLDPESFTQSFDTYKSKIASGRVLGLIDGKWEFNEAEQVLRDAGKFEKTYMAWPLVMDPNTQKFVYRQKGEDLFNNVGWSIPKTANKPEKLIKFWDYLTTEEGMVLREWGVEGEHYDIVDGKRVMKKEVADGLINKAEDTQKKTGIGVFGSGSGNFLCYGVGAMDKSGQSITWHAPLDDTFTVAEKEALKAYGYTDFEISMVPQAETLPRKPWGLDGSYGDPNNEEMKVAMNTINDGVMTHIASIVLSKPEKFEEGWAKFEKFLLDNKIEQLEKAVKDHMIKQLEFWGEKK